MNGSNPLLKSIGTLSGCGCMVLSTQRQDKPKAWILPTVNIELFNRVLTDFAEHFGVGQHKRIVLAVDQAGWHSSKQVKVPQGIHLIPMLSHSPELQPAERLWPLTNEPIVNRAFETLDELEEVLVHRCQALLKQQDLIRGLTYFYWWPREAT